MEWIEVTTEAQLLEAKRIRQQVFVEEQGVAEELEHDQYDVLNEDCLHMLLLQQGQPIGTGRVKFLNAEYAKLQRICVQREARGNGAGVVIVTALETLAKRRGVKKVQLGAQLHAKLFYEKLGYEMASDVFIEAGIQHVLMQKELQSSDNALA